MDGREDEGGRNHTHTHATFSQKRMVGRKEDGEATHIHKVLLLGLLSNSRKGIEG
jgi:hypothetical protein